MWRSWRVRVRRLKNVLLIDSFPTASGVGRLIRVKSILVTQDHFKTAIVVAILRFPTGAVACGSKGDGFLTVQLSLSSGFALAIGFLLFIKKLCEDAQRSWKKTCYRVWLIFILAIIAINLSFAWNEIGLLEPSDSASVL